MKTCFKCSETKPLSEFYKHKAMADGHLNKCKDCTKKDTHDHRHGKGRDRVLQYDRDRASLPHRRAAMIATVKKWQENYPERKKAQTSLNNAVRDGHIKPLPCFCCGEKAEAHHPDYGTPLDVVWLCSAHHKQAHALGQSLMKGKP